LIGKQVARAAGRDRPCGYEKNRLCDLGHSPPPGKTVMSPPWTSDEQPGLLAWASGRYLPRWWSWVHSRDF